MVSGVPSTVQGKGSAAFFSEHFCRAEIGTSRHENIAPGNHPTLFFSKNILESDNLFTCLSHVLD